jgi:pimeloyl-ACP methyl ester carboxylesterase
MSTFVLVHGSFHGGWCWEKVVPRLEEDGHRAVAVDLPGRAGDGRPLASLTLDDYLARVGEAVAAQAEPVVLVGHSMGGVVITGVAERMPEKLKRLVYVCAFLPASGQSLYDLAKTDTDSLLMRHLVIDEAKGIHRVKPEGARESFLHDCSDEDAERAAARLTDEPLAPVSTPVVTTGSRFGRVSRSYVECTEDRAISPSVQRRMHAAQPCKVTRLASSHSPFYAQPDELARILVESVIA